MRRLVKLSPQILCQNFFKPSAAASVRSKHKVNIQKPWAGPFERRVIVDVTRPVYPVVDLDPATVCTRRDSLLAKGTQLTQYEQFLVKHQKKILDRNANGIIALFHQVSVDTRQQRRTQVTLNKKDFYKIHINRKVMNEVVKNTRFEALMIPIFQDTIMVVCPTPKVAEMLVIVKKIPELHLLCASVEGRFLSRSQVGEYSTYPGRDTLLAQTCALLSHSTQKTSQLLGHHQSELSRILTQVTEQHKED